MNIAQKVMLSDAALIPSDINMCWKIEGNIIESTDIDTILNSVQKSDNIFWGFTPISPIHLGYDKIFFILNEITKVTECNLHMLATDICGTLTHRLGLEELKTRALYYKHYIERVWDQNITFTLSSSYYFNKDYQTLLLTLLSRVNDKVVRKTWNSDQKQMSLLYSYFYPLIQVIDIIYLKPKVVFAEHSQAKIYELLPEVLKILNLNLNPIYFIYMNQSTDIKGKSLKSSTSRDRISLHEEDYTLKSKLSNCSSFLSTQSNPLLELLEFSVLPFRNKYKIDLELEISGRRVLITNRNELRNLVVNGHLILPECLSEVYSWTLQRLSASNLIYHNQPGLMEWIILDKIRGN